MAEKETEVRERLGLALHGHQSRRADRAVGTAPSADHRTSTDDHGTTDERGQQLMDTAEIRRRFLAHFEGNGHQVVPSASLLLDDPNLLFVNAGMVPFKPYFLGQETPPYDRAVSVQKCVRTLDIDEVGKTTRHGTFFQMCGNFSFGDYFKEGAIELAWELVTKPQADGGYGFEASRLYPSVYDDDPEAVDAVEEVTGLPDERIVRLGKEENYWSMGVPGPGGPCSEILFDRGPAYGADAATGKRRATATWRSGTWCSCRTSSARCAARTTSTSSAPLPKQEHRHRHGPGAGGVPAAGQGQHVRDRRDLPGDREGRRS